MKCVLQRVHRAAVTVEQEVVGSIDQGWMVLVGISDQDEMTQAQAMVDKILGLRCFSDSSGKMNQSLKDIGGGLLLVSQFTLYADCRRGRRPSFGDAANSGHARVLFANMVAYARSQHETVATGRFGALMSIDMVADGPVTIPLD